MISFIENVNQAWKYLNQAILVSDLSGNRLNHPSEARPLIDAGIAHFRRAVQCLDTSQIPVVYRADVSREAVLLLKEILDRIALPDWEDIPGDEAVQTESSHESMRQWRIPKTEITIRRVDNGDREGQFLFSAETVAQLETFYGRVRHLPYRPGVIGGFFEWYSLSPGNLLPPRWLLSLVRFSELPSWLVREIWDQTIWQWLALFLTLLVTVKAIIFAGGLYRAKMRGKAAALRQRALRILFMLLAVGILTAAAYVIDDVVNITGRALLVVVGFLVGLRLLFWACLVFQGCNFLAELFVLSPRIDSRGIDGSMVRTMANLIGIFLSLSLFFYGAGQLGVSIVPVITGLGVVGLALSLAAKPTVENVIGGLTLFADRPVRVGDFCRFGGTSGTVVEIGLRSTRIQGLDRTVTSIPNAEFSQLQLVNVSRRDYILLETTLGLRYETTLDQLRWVLARLREMLLAHPEVHDFPEARVRFVGFNAYSLDISVRAYIATSDLDVFLAVQEDILFRIGEIVDQAGTAFAFPSNTTYVTRDAAPERKRREEVEEEFRKESDGVGASTPGTIEEQQDHAPFESQETSEP